MAVPRGMQADEAKERAKSNFSQDTRNKAYDAKEEAKQAAEDAKHGIQVLPPPALGAAHPL